MLRTILSYARLVEPVKMLNRGKAALKNVMGFRAAGVIWQADMTSINPTTLGFYVKRLGEKFLVEILGITYGESTESNLTSRGGNMVLKNGGCGQNLIFEKCDGSRARPINVAEARDQAI